LSEKFTQLAGSVLGPAGAAALWHAVATTGVDDSVDSILDLLSARAGSFAGPGPANFADPGSAKHAADQLRRTRNTRRTGFAGQDISGGST
jgi:hypothetical protein